jgi:hypothetical protein
MTTVPTSSESSPARATAALNDDRAKIGRGNFFQAAAKGTDRGPHWRDNNDKMLRHDQTLLIRRAVGPEARPSDGSGAS